MTTRPGSRSSTTTPTCRRPRSPPTAAGRTSARYGSTATTTSGARCAPTASPSASAPATRPIGRSSTPSRASCRTSCATPSTTGATSSSPATSRSTTSCSAPRPPTRCGSGARRSFANGLSARSLIEKSNVLARLHLRRSDRLAGAPRGGRRRRDLRRPDAPHLASRPAPGARRSRLLERLPGRAGRRRRRGDRELRRPRRGAHRAPRRLPRRRAAGSPTTRSPPALFAPASARGAPSQLRPASRPGRLFRPPNATS